MAAVVLTWPILLIHFEAFGKAGFYYLRNSSGSDDSGDFCADGNADEAAAVEQVAPVPVAV